MGKPLHHVLKGFLLAQIHLLIFQCLKEALRYGVLIGIASPGHADGQAVAPQFLYNFPGRILHSGHNSEKLSHSLKSGNLLGNQWILEERNASNAHSLRCSPQSVRGAPQYPLYRPRTAYVLRQIKLLPKTSLLRHKSCYQHLAWLN